MVKSLSTHDLEGRDVEAPANAGEFRGSDTTTIPQGGRGRILLSMMGSDGSVHHAAIVLPGSYLVCFSYCKMAIDFIVECLGTGGEGNGD